MIIEFFGISGVGKSTIALKEYDRLFLEGEKVFYPRYSLYEEKNWYIRNIYKVVSCIGVIVRCPEWSFIVFKFLKKLKLEKKDFWVLLLNYIFLKYIQKRHSEDDKIYIYDEGVIQIIWATYLRINKETSEQMVAQIISFFKVPDKLIVVQANAETIVERLITRGRHTKIMEDSCLLEKVKRMIEKEQEIIKLIVETEIIGEESIVYYDNEGFLK